MTSDICLTVCAVKKFCCILWNFCFNFVSVLKKKINIKNLDPDISIVSSNNESESPAIKKDSGWVREVFFCANGH